MKIVFRSKLNEKIILLDCRNMFYHMCVQCLSTVILLRLVNTQNNIIYKWQLVFVSL